MATKPTEYPRWADNTVIDPITGANNKVEPTEEFKLSGLLRAEFLPRAYLNYQFNNIASWLMYNDSTAVFDLSGATEISRANGYKQTLTLTQNEVLTEVLTDGEEVELYVTYGGFTITWPASFNWGDAGAPAGFSSVVVRARKIGSIVYATTDWSQT